MRLGRCGNGTFKLTDICTYLHPEVHLTGGQEAVGIGRREGMCEGV